MYHIGGNPPTGQALARTLMARRIGAGQWMARCPSHDDSTPSLSISEGEGGKALVRCHAGCTQVEVIDALRGLGLWPRHDGREAVRQRPGPAPEHPQSVPGEECRDEQRLAKARWLWGRSQPARGTLAERYLASREIRLCELPGTLRFLPALRIGQHPAMIAVFGLPHENRPGELVMPPSRIRGVHLTLLKADGSGKTDTRPNKLMVGASSGSPIVVAPANDLGGLAICEGIEDALSLHQATGLGAWAAGSANRLARLADLVPSSVETVTVAVDDDTTSRRGSYELARRLEGRGIEAILFDPSRAAA